MQLKFAFLLVAFAFVGAKGECGEEEAGACMLKLLSDVWEEVSDEQECSSLAEATSCLAESSKGCIGEAENGDLEEVRNLFRTLGALKCPQKEVSEEEERCVEDLESELMTCIEDSVSDLLERLMEQPDKTVDDDKIKCDMYHSISECVATKVAENCGEKASVAVLAEMLADDEIKETCKIPDASEITIREILVDMDKKRRK